MKRTRFFARLSAVVAPLFAAAMLVTFVYGSAYAAPPVKGLSSKGRAPSHPRYTPHVIMYPTLSAWRAHHRTGNTAPQGNGDLVYNGGAVLHDPVTYLIFWGSYWNNGSGGLTADAQVVVNYFNDMGTTEFENVLTQYSDTKGPIADTEHVVAVWNDTATPPTDTMCNSSPTIEDTSIASEVSHAISTEGWSKDTTNAVYFVYTPPNYYVRVSNACSNIQFCAYHSWNNVAYAALPYPNQSTCPAIQSPNGNAAGDSLANSSSHEQFEAITDPFPCGYGCSATAWIDNANYEIGDKCDWNFDSGGTSLNNSGTFYIQTEYSNVSHSCVNAYNSSPHMRLTPTSVSINAQAGVNPSPQHIALENTTWNTLNWTAAQLPSWVSVSPTSGSVAAGATQQLTLTFNTASYQPQTLAVGLVITGNADNSPTSASITVTLVGGTLNGHVDLWPTAPDCLSSASCLAPLAGRQVNIYTSANTLVTTLTTDQNGTFSMALSPGAYSVKVVLSPSLPGMRQITSGSVSIAYQTTTSVTILVDSGLR
jgi:hypothetical protein